MHYALCIMHYALCIMHFSFCIMQMTMWSGDKVTRWSYEKVKRLHICKHMAYMPYMAYGIWHVAYGIWHISYDIWHMVWLGAMTDLRVQLANRSLFDFFKCHIIARNGEQEFHQYLFFLKLGKTFVKHFKHAFIIGFTPYVFVITGIVASTAFRWLFGFWCHQLKKWFVWNKWTRPNLFLTLIF